MISKENLRALIGWAPILIFGFIYEFVMKSFTKFFMVVSLLGLMMSCDNRTEEQRWKDYQARTEKARQDSIKEAKYHGFRTIVIDSCEYLIKTEKRGGGDWSTRSGYMAHKGNCRFCEERRKREGE